jgi:hypothetical protein
MGYTNQRISDVVYDPCVFGGLRKTLLHFMSRDKTVEAIFACTLRNKETLEKFLETLGDEFTKSEEVVPQKQYFVYENEFPVKIYRLLLK